MFIANTNKFLDIIWPVLFEWANIHSYILPDEYCINSILVKKVDSIYCATKNSITVGQYNKADKQIKLLFPNRSKQQKMLTLAHEYAHAIQHYNLRKGYNTQYSSETKEHGYYENRFEIEARFMASLLELEFENTQSKIAKQLKKFNWLLTKSERNYSSWTVPKETGKHWQPHHWHGKFQGFYN